MYFQLHVGIITSIFFQFQILARTLRPMDNADLLVPLVFSK